MRLERKTTTDSGSVFRRLFGERGARSSSPRESQVIAIASGKGGTGKSFLATNLAVGLSAAGRAVTLVDGDFGLGNAHLLLGVNPRATLQHVIAGQASIEQVRCATGFGPCLVPAGSGISRLAELSEREMLALVQALSRLAATEDVLLLDTAAGISPQSLLTLLLADHVVLVTNPEIAAMTDAYALIKCLTRQPDPPPTSIVVNRVAVPGFGRATFQRLSDVARRFAGCDVHYLGEVPEDAAVTQRRLGQPPLLVSHPECPTAQCLYAILDQLSRRCGGLEPKPRAAGRELLQRLRSRLALQPTG
ncbi:MAG: P-loop NTPase [Planctomycetota bacterium]